MTIDGLEVARSHRGARAGIVGLVLALVLLGTLALEPVPAHADTIEVSAFTEKAPDPRSVTFGARINAAAGVKSARLVYRVLNPDGNVGGESIASVAPGTELDVSVELVTNGGDDRYIPVGSTFSYSWVVEDNSGATFTSPAREFQFLDGRYNWNQRTEGTSPAVTVFWYGGNEGRATQVLDATRTSLAKVGDLLQTQVPYPIKVVVYGSESDGELAQRPRGRTFDETVSTGGTRVAPDLVLVFFPDVDIVMHEVAHIVTHVAGDGPFSQLPSWLDEGTAVWAQRSPGSGYLGALGLAIQADRTLNLRSMQSATNRPEEVNLFYGQSFSVVDYLLTSFGRERFAELYRVYHEGSPIDRALEQVYGTDTNGLYNAWRESKGLARVEFAASSGSTAPGSAATVAPLGIPTSVAGGSTQPSTTGATDGAPVDGAATAASEESEGVPMAALAIGAGTLVLVALLAGGMFALLRKKGSGPSAA